jgi:hypothetical protein
MKITEIVYRFIDRQHDKYNRQNNKTKLLKIIAKSNNENKIKNEKKIETDVFNNSNNNIKTFYQYK